MSSLNRHRTNVEIIFIVSRIGNVTIILLSCQRHLKIYIILIKKIALQTLIYSLLQVTSVTLILN